MKAKEMNLAKGMAMAELFSLMGTCMMGSIATVKGTGRYVSGAGVIPNFSANFADCREDNRI